MQGTFRIEVLRCTFLEDKMHTIFNGEYNEEKSLPLFARSRVIRSKWNIDESTDDSSDSSAAAAATDLTQFWPGDMPAPSDKPMTSVRHTVNWNVPDAADTDSIDAKTPSENSVSAASSFETKVRYVTFTYPTPGQKATNSTAEHGAGVGGNKKDAGKNKGKGKGKGSKDISSTPNVVAPPLVRLPIQTVPKVQPSSNILQRSKSFNMDDTTLTELANSELVIEVWAGEERNPGLDGSTDRLLGSGSISRIMKNWMAMWPQAFESIVDLQGPMCGETSPHVVVRVVPDSTLSTYMRGARLLTVKNPGLWRLPARWVWNVVPPEPETEEEEGKGKKTSAKGKKDADGDGSTFPHAQCQFVMGVSLVSGNRSSATINSNENKSNNSHVVYLHGGTVDADKRRECTDLSGYVGNTQYEEGDEENQPTGPVSEVYTVPKSPKMLPCEVGIVTWETNLVADFFMSAETVGSWKDSSTKETAFSLSVQLARLEGGYSAGVDKRILHTSSMLTTLSAADSSDLASGGVIEVFSSSIPLDSLLSMGSKSITVDKIALQKEAHFAADKKTWLSLLTDENLIEDRRNTEAQAKIDYVQSETKRRMADNEDDDIDDSDLPSLDSVTTSGSVDQDGDFAQLFAPYNQVPSVGSGLPPTLAAQPLDAVLTLSIYKPVIPNTSTNPKDRNLGNKGWMKFNRAHSGKNEAILKKSALAESCAIRALSDEMTSLENALREVSVLNGGTSSSRLSLSTSDYEAFRARMKVQMLTILKAQLNQQDEVAQDQAVSMSNPSSGNPLDMAPRKTCATKHELAMAIAHTKRTARTVVESVFGGDVSSSNNQKVDSKVSTKQILVNGWQSLVDGDSDKAVKGYTNRLQCLEKNQKQQKDTTTVTEHAELWHALAQARIAKADLVGAAVCLDAGLNIDAKHADSLMLRSCVEVEIQLPSVSMKSLSYVERATSSKTTRSILFALHRLANNDTKALQTLMGLATNSSPWIDGVTPPRPQAIVASLHTAARYFMEHRLIALSSAVLDMSRAEERHIDAASSDVYPLARAVREAAYRGKDSVIARVRDAKGRHIGLWACWNSVRASMNIRAAERDAMKAAAQTAKKGRHNNYKENRKKKKIMTPTLVDKKAAEGASEAAGRSSYDISGGTLDAQLELECLITNKMASLTSSTSSIQCETPEGRVRYALAQFRRAPLDNDIHTKLFGMVHNGNRTGVLWSRDRASTYTLAWRGLSNPDRDPLTARKMFEFITRENPQLAGAWCGLGLCQMYNNEHDSAQQSLELACSLDAEDLRNWLSTGCNALCRGDAGVAEASQCARRIVELGHTTATAEKSPIIMCRALMQDFVDGLQQFETASSNKLVERHLALMTANVAAKLPDEKQLRPSTVPVFSSSNQ